MDLVVDVEQTDAVVIVKVTGEIDLASAPTLKDALSRIDGHAPVVIDLSDVSFLDSSGLSVLVASWKDLSTDQGPGDFRLVVTRPAIQRVLDVTGLSDVFSVYGSLDEAIGA